MTKLYFVKTMTIKRVKMSLNDFDAIAYINLKHRKDRKKHILKELSRLKVNKKKIHHVQAHFVPFNGHLGCILSHIDALDWAIKQKLNNILILEDDCFFIDDANFINKTVEYFLSLVAKWDVYLFGGYFEKKQKSPYP